ncbi:hypothetical protein M436DRAFT_62503 [Aureobasidium namibiae CBS 147.97]|uniref:F-box domain-containing protein n=1 Tax=Aureobasidium namibiae CBS 147.97 TaxID=1043004 RepID=A0A074WPN1_9PEZI|nr:uncharacterized protein M436DRAFT_62503 [Aureobasidium namibiae CBS 147.97]KEQ75095.1 hypothetical protein M436DRAFT_62503 [Aureobasidium namibiae CBS 147.97]
MDQSLNVLELPTEVLSRICDETEDSDLSNLRLVCKRFYDVSTPRFAVVNFTKTVHVVSPYSIDTLVNIMEHPVFGDYVHHVAICSARRTQQPATAYELPAAIINHNSCLSSYVDRFGMNNYSPSLVAPMRCCGWTIFSESLSTFVTCRTAETLEETIYAARRVRCPVRCLEITYLNIRFHSPIMYEELDAAMHGILRSSLMPFNINLGGEDIPQMSYSHVSQQLNFRWFTDGRNSMSGYGARALYTWLQTQKVTKFSLTNSCDLRTPTFRPMFSLHLRHLNIDNASVYAPTFDQNLWSVLIESISNSFGLEYCRLSNLTYRIDLTSSDEVDHTGYFVQYLVLPGHGEYVWTCRLAEFRLLLPGGATSVELDGPEICERLLDLSHYVRAAENSKCQRIVSDGAVKDDIVGVQRQDQK